MPLKGTNLQAVDKKCPGDLMQGIVILDSTVL